MNDKIEIDITQKKLNVETNEKINVVVHKTDLTNYYTKAETDLKFLSKEEAQNTYATISSVDELSNIINSNSENINSIQSEINVMQESLVNVKSSADEAKNKAQEAYNLALEIDGSPKGVYANLSALQTAFPNGASGVYLTSDNGHWYYWNGSDYADGGVYQSSEDIEQIKENLSELVEVTNVNREGSGQILVSLNVVANNTYKLIANVTISSVRTQKTDGTTIENFSDNVQANTEFVFTPTQNAPILRLYLLDSGNVRIENLTNRVPILEEKTNKLETTVEDINKTVSEIEWKKTTNTVIGGFYNIYENIKKGDKFTVKNKSGVNTALTLRNSSNVTLATITNNLANNTEKTFVSTIDADRMVVYLSNPNGYFECIKLSKSIPFLFDTVGNIEKLIVCGFENSESLWENGGYGAGSGVTNGNAYNLRTKDFLNYVSCVTVDSQYKLMIYAWDSNDGSFKGIWNNESKSFGDSFKYVTEFNLDGFKIKYPTYQYKLVLETLDKSNIDLSAYEHVYFNNYIPRFFETRRKPMLTFIDDDGFAESGRIWEDIIDTINIPVTFALPTNSIGNNVGKLTWDDVERMNNRGFEFISHTHGHIDLAHDESMTEEEVISDFNSTIAALREHGCNSEFVVYPHTICTDRNKAIVKRYFSLGIAQDNRINTMENGNRTHVFRYNLNRSPMVLEEMTVNGELVYAYPYKSFDEMKALIDDVIANNGWLIFMSHLRNTCNHTTGGDGFYYDDGVKDMIVKSCEYALNKGVEIVSVSDGYKTFRRIFK